MSRLRVVALAVLLVAGFVATGAGLYLAGKHSADRWYNTEPDVMNCPTGHVCQWAEIDTTAYHHCLKNCGPLEELDSRIPCAGSIPE